ncbi:MAG: DUF3748 domain-containing protein [Opitutaceae bacterium]|jgi:hypothetical protein
MKLTPPLLAYLCTCAPTHAQERQLTFDAGGHILTNTAAWSGDSQWLFYDVRSMPETFDGDRINRVNVQTGTMEMVYHAPGGSACGVITCHPHDPIVVFIQGPETPDDAWSYGASRRRGVTVDLRLTGDQRVRPLDAANYAPPFTTGALRGGSHVHVFSGDGQWVSFTYEDELLTRPAPGVVNPVPNQRNIGVSIPAGPVSVNNRHPRNHNGDWFSVLVTCTVARPRRGSDDINLALEEGWIGLNGYVRADGSRQAKALAFQGRVTALDGREHREVFIVDLPEDLTQAGERPLCGTITDMPFPPKGVRQRRLTFTDDRVPRGIQGPRHWLRSSPDGSSIAFLMRDKAGVVQCWLVSPLGGAPRQLTHIAERPGIASAFTWSPDGITLAAVVDDRVCLIDASNGQIRALTPPHIKTEAPLDLACVFSPDGRSIAFQRKILSPDGTTHPQIFVVSLSSKP